MQQKENQGQSDNYERLRKILAHSNKENTNLVPLLLLLLLMYCRKSHKTNYKDDAGKKEKYSKNERKYLETEYNNALYLKVLRQ